MPAVRKFLVSVLASVAFLVVGFVQRAAAGKAGDYTNFVGLGEVADRIGYRVTIAESSPLDITPAPLLASYPFRTHHDAGRACVVFQFKNQNQNQP